MAVVDDDVQLAALAALATYLGKSVVGLAMPLLAGVRDPSGGDIEGGEQVVAPLRLSWVAAFSGSPLRNGRMGAVRFSACIWDSSMHAKIAFSGASR